MEKPAVNGSPRHWSTSPLKLGIVLAAVFTVLQVLVLSLSLTVIPWLNETHPPTWEYPPFWMFLVIVGTLTVLLPAVVYGALTSYVLQAQTRRGLTDRAMGRIGWPALMAMAVIVAVFLLLLPYPTPIKLDMAQMGMRAASMAMYTMGSLLSQAMLALAALLLLPTIRQGKSRTLGVLWAAAVVFAPVLATRFTATAWQESFSSADLLMRLPAQAGLDVAFMLICAVLIRAVSCRLWDTILVQGALFQALTALCAALLEPESGPAIWWQFETRLLALALLPALAALYCLLMWDRGISPARPFVAFARRVRALAQHFLPI